MCVSRTPPPKIVRQKEEKNRPLVTKHNNNIEYPGGRKTCQRLPPIHHTKKRATHNAEECPLPFSHSPRPEALVEQLAQARILCASHAPYPS